MQHCVSYYLFNFTGVCLILAGNHFLGLGTLPESILEPTGKSLHVSHTSSTNSSPSLSLGTPVEVPHLFGRVSTTRACLLLDVVRNLATTAACRV